MKKALLSLLMGLLFMTLSYAQENFQSPIVIGQLDGTYECGVIYTDTNNTCSFIDDVPNTHVSPDVVYQFALTNPGIVNMNLCNAATDYDTYLLLYNETFSQIAYDDDGCGIESRSKIETTLAAGTYYIVVEGWSNRCGNYHLEVSYNIPPTPSVVNLPDLTGSCSIASASAPEASSYCSATIIGTTETVFPILSSTVITWIYDDGFGNIATQTQNVIITDNTPPVPDITSLPDIVDDCEITTLIEPTATDNCAGEIIGIHDAVLPIYSSTTITWTYTDSNGNTSTQTQNVIINDNTPPVLDLASLDDIVDDCEITTLIEPTATDNCAGEIIGIHDAVLPIYSSTTITWTYTAPNGNTSTQTQNVIINDFTLPVPDLATLPDIETECEVISLITPTATDNCAGEIEGIHDATLPITTQGTTVVTWTYTDNNENSITQTQNIIIEDVTAPTIICPADITTNTDMGIYGAIVAYELPVVTDNCGFGTNLIINGDASDGLNNWTITASGGNGWEAAQGSFKTSHQWCRKYQVVDLLAAGYEASMLDLSPKIFVSEDYQSDYNANDPYYLKVQLRDASNEVIASFDSGTLLTSNDWQTISHTFAEYGEGLRYIYFEHGGMDVQGWGGFFGARMTNAIVKLENPALTINLTAGLSSNSFFPVGTTTNTFEAIDAVGNTSTCSFDVIVVNNNLETPIPDLAILSDIEAECEVTYLVEPTATDNIDGEIIGVHNASLPITAQGTTVVTWTYTDSDDNTFSQTQNVIINDITGPVADIPVLSDVTAECEVTSLTPPTATDNCGGLVIVTNDATLPITTQGTTIVTWTYEDSNGNTTTQTQNVVINDLTAPVLDVAELATLTADCEITSWAEPTATDNCGGVITGLADITLPIQETTNITWTYEDSNGNTTTQTQNVVINDVTAPVPDITDLADVTAECEITNLTAPTATDNCGGLVTVTNDATLPITTQGTTIVTWTYEDSNGNTTTQTQNVVINDVTAPVADIDELVEIEECFELTSLTEPSATDNCGGLVTVSHDATLPIIASTTITWTYEDGNGNSSTQTQNVIIEDVTGPVADIPVLSDVTAECEVTSLTPPTATDNCGGLVIVTNDATLPITTQGTTIVTWTYEDSKGNTTTQTQNVIIEDVTGPVADIPVLSDVTAECEVTSLTPPTATDNCGGLVIVTNDATLPITTQGTTIVTWTYEDSNGNTTTQTQNVVINDLTAPVLDVAELATLTADCEITSWAEPTATDNCGGVITGLADITLPIQETTNITWTYEDSNGNTTTQTQNVVINDVTAPVPDITDLADVTAECEITNLTAPTATDNCGGLVTVTNDATLPITTQGTTIVTWTYEDSNGNTTTQTQNVVINDVTAPIPDIVVLADVTAECEVTSLSVPTATDNCGGLVIVTSDATLPITTQGTTIVTWTFADGNGNSVTQTQNVVIDDVTAPVPDLDELAEIEACFELATLTEPSATDNCSNIVSISHDAALPIIASTTVTWTFADANGNASTQTQSIVINTVDVSVTDNSPVLTANAVGATYQWIDCDNANAPISGETGSSFTATENGNYAVEVTQNGCTAISDCISVLNVGINTANNDFDVNIYPNPTSNLLFIEFANTEDVLWNLNSITGQIVLEGHNYGSKFSINMNDLTPGVYVLKIQQKDRIITKRIVRN